ncbi:MAG TPA: DUF4249 domain-containing protein [Bacteroidales bacterium]|nr:DUF4249 domain-containing protein [Bacteroidales bacterium]
MKKIIKYCFIFLIALIPEGCETDAVNVKVPDFEQKLVVTGFISPSDTVSYIFVTSNWPIYGLVKTDQSIGRLSGSISDGVNTAPLDTFRKGMKFDQSRFKINYGKKYNLSIRNDRGLSVEATCQIPERRPFVIMADTAWLPMRHGWAMNEKSLQMIVKVKDIGNEENFYNVGSKGIISGKLPSGELIRHSFNNYEEVKSDKGLDGQELEWQIDTGFRDYARLISAEITIYLYHTEESYYLYHRSLEKYHDNGNPFAESTPVYSNITGGLGVFTSYTVDSLIFSIK